MRGQLSRISEAVGHAVMLTISSFISYGLITHILTRVYFAARDDELLGGMWAVIATVFVYHYNYEQSMSAALLAIAATCVSFALCLVYLLILPFSPWGMAALIGIGAIAVDLAGRPEDIIWNYDCSRDGSSCDKPTLGGNPSCA